MELDYDQIIPGLYIGTHLISCGHIDQLKEKSAVTAVLNLQMDDDMACWRLDWPTLAAHYRAAGIEVCRVPIRDFDSEDLVERLSDSVETLHQLVQDGHTVYVHCTAGVWRAPTVVIAYLHWCHGWGLEEALVHVKRQRPCSPSLEALRRASLRRSMHRQGDR